MNLTITQNNLFLILPSKVGRLAEMISTHGHIDIVEAVKHVYQSDTYHQLEQESTKQWHLGPVALFQEITASKAV